MGKLISKSEIFSKKGLDARTVFVPEWGGDVLYRPMSMVERREIRKKCSNITTGANGETQVDLDAEKMEVMAVIFCVIDPNDPAKRRLMFGPDDVSVLEEELTAGAVSTVAQAILRDSGLAGNSQFRGEKKTEE